MSRRSLPAQATWPALGTRVVLRVTNASGLEPARLAVADELAAIDLACSRFRPDSELSRLNANAGRPLRVSPLFAEALSLALRAAALTNGDVDPTVGRALVLAGYDRDHTLLDRDLPDRDLPDDPSDRRPPHRGLSEAPLQRPENHSKTGARARARVRARAPRNETHTPPAPHRTLPPLVTAHLLGGWRASNVPKGEVIHVRLVPAHEDGERSALPALEADHQRFVRPFRA